MSRRNPLKIPVEEIPDAGEEVVFDEALPQFAALLAEATENTATGRAELKLERWPKRVDVEGTLTAEVGQTCVRCLNAYRQPLKRGMFQILMREAAGDDEDDEEIELTDDDLDRSEIVDDVVDLETLLREEIQLALPLKPLCKDECKGICQGCGAELNDEACTCEPEIDSRWAALKDLKLGD
ncbi:MAG: DUF177 domain-containing protein [Proteobacteria bacterium]|nr:DUF177 domain-containing protein [Pseudomonadota bacterium]